MYYLVIENLGIKRCIDKYEKNIYKDGQTYNCLKNMPFNENGKKVAGTVKIRCIDDPGKITEAVVYAD